MAALQSTAGALEQQVTWFPDYGCALVRLPAQDVGSSISAQPSALHLLLVGLDGWDHHLHSTRSVKVGAGNGGPFARLPRAAHVELTPGCHPPAHASQRRGR